MPATALMMKCIVLILMMTVIAAQKSVAAVMDQDCEPVNWEEYYAQIGMTNSIVSFVSNSTLIGYFRKYFDTTHLIVDRQEPLYKNVLGTTYKLETVLVDMQIDGLKNVRAHPINVLSHNTLQIGVTSADVLNVNGTFHTKYTKEMATIPILNWKYCPHELKFWLPCPTRTLTIDTHMSLDQLSAESQIEVNIYRCNRKKGFWGSLSCRFTSGWAYLKSLFNNGNMLNNGFAAEVMKRMKSAHVNDVNIRFKSSSITTNLRVDKDVDSTADVMDIIAETELHIKRELTAGFFRDCLFHMTNFAAKKAGNAAIKVIEPLFESKCSRR